MARLRKGSRRGNEADGCARWPGNPPRYLGGYGPRHFSDTLSAKRILQQLVRVLSDLGGKIVRAVGMLDSQVLRRTIKLIDRLRSPNDLIHAGPFKIGIAERSADENRAGRQRADQFMKIKGD